MKQILNINLGGYPITIDTDAYDHLNHYLDAIERHFRDSDSSEEIINDIEARMAELFDENLGARSIVTIGDVRAAIDIMGHPEMFGAEPIEEDIDSSSKSKSKKAKSSIGFNPGKKLFRDEDNKIVGGVASGLAAYLGVNDPLWVRLIFIVLSLAGFSGGFIYLILWIAVPSAKTSSDRLAMKGEPIDIENIAKSVEEEIDKFSSKVNKKYGSKKKSGDDRNASATSNLVSNLGGIVSATILGLVRVARPVVHIIGIALIIGLIGLMIGSVITSVFGLLKAGFFFPANQVLFSIGIISLFLLIGIPLLGIVLSIAKRLFYFTVSGPWRISLLVLWGLSWIGLGASSAVVGKGYQSSATYRQSTPIIANQDQPIKIVVDKVPLSENDGRHIPFGKDVVKFELDMIKLSIHPAEDQKFRIVQVQKAYGKSQSDASKGAKYIEYQPTVTGNVLHLPSDFFLPKKDRFRAQSIDLQLFIPIGQQVVLDRSVDKLELDIDTDDYAFYQLRDQEAVMTAQGLRLANEPKSKEDSPILKEAEVLSFSDFSTISAEGPIQLNIQQGESYRVKLKNITPQDFDELKTLGQELMIEVDEDKGQGQIFVTMPHLTQLDAEHSGDIFVSGFNEKTMEIELEGNMEADLNVQSKNLSIEASDNVEIILKGKADHFEAELKDNVQLLGDSFDTQEGDIQIDDNAASKIKIKGKLKEFGKN